MKYKDISSFLTDLKNTKKAYQYKCGNDFEQIKYEYTNKKGNDIYSFYQIEPNEKEPFFSDYIYDYELHQILSSQLINRDYKNAIALNTLEI